LKRRCHRIRLAAPLHILGYSESFAGRIFGKVRTRVRPEKGNSR